jgi:D-alanine-D-alanine ligase
MAGHRHDADATRVVRRLRVGVLYGGRSGEHEVSLASDAAVFANLDRTRYEPVPIRIDRDGRWALPPEPPSAERAAEVIEQARVGAARLVGGAREVHVAPRPGHDTILAVEGGLAGAGAGALSATGLDLDVVFPVLHGPYGEDGTVQGLLELAGLPYVGAGVLSSAVGMDKVVMKVLFVARGLPVPDYLVVAGPEWRARPDAVVEHVTSRLAWPVFVKPANLGSSVGISKARDRSELERALALAAEFDRKILVEAAVPRAREIECGVLGNDAPQASVPGEIIPSREFYDYEAKYLDAASRHVIPAPIGEQAAAAIRRMSIEAFQAIDGAGMARVDFLLDGDRGDIYVNEINTIPGFTTISMFAKLWEATGVSYPELLDRLIQLALERHAEKQSLRISAI